MDNKKVAELMDRIDDTENTLAVVNKIIQYKDYLTSVSEDQLQVTQKLWLLAHEASEIKLEKMSDTKNDKTTMDFVLSMLILNDFIPEEFS